MIFWLTEIRQYNWVFCDNSWCNLQNSLKIILQNHSKELLLTLRNLKKFSWSLYQVFIDYLCFSRISFSWWGVGVRGQERGLSDKCTRWLCYLQILQCKNLMPIAVKIITLVKQPTGGWTNTSTKLKNMS